jgi:GNAT superfamily N-acetyltransferase
MSSPAPLFVDHALAARLEAVEAVQLAALAGHVGARVPAPGGAALQLAGGAAVFLGRGISLSRATGLGMGGPVTAADAAALEDFYLSRRTDARIFVSPYADPSLLAHLGARGFALDSLDTILVRRLDPAERLAAVPGVEVTLAGPGDAAPWVASSMAGFGAAGAPNAVERSALFEAAFTLPGTTYFLASIEGRLAATGALYQHGRTAYLFAASTVPAARGRGAQAALIQARLAAAQALGCDLAFTGTGPGTASQRNFERRGFAPVYSEALLVKPFRGV